MATTDFLVVGGGIIGVSIARELRRRHSDRSVTVLEKEPACGRHASGRNSGVLHAGPQASEGASEESPRIATVYSTLGLRPSSIRDVFTVVRSAKGRDSDPELSCT